MSTNIFTEEWICSDFFILNSARCNVKTVRNVLYHDSSQLKRRLKRHLYDIFEMPPGDDTWKLIFCLKLKIEIKI